MANADPNPETLFRFYSETYKRIYSEIQSLNRMDEDALLHTNDAFERLARYWLSEPKDTNWLEAAILSLKRACARLYRLNATNFEIEAARLLRLDTSEIAEGQYYAAMRKRAGEIRELICAGEEQFLGTDDDFEHWKLISDQSDDFHRVFFLHREVDWSKLKARPQP